MSKYEGMHGKGVARQADLRILRRELQEIYNRLFDQVPSKGRRDFQKANTRTKSFPIADHDGQEAEYWGFGHRIEARSATQLEAEGQIYIDPDQGTFRFEVWENNHAVERANRSPLLQKLDDFMEKLPYTGTTYGAETYYWSEYDQDEHGHKAPGTYSYYGSWKHRRR
jgi:hypothetical protein